MSIDGHLRQIHNRGRITTTPALQLQVENTSGFTNALGRFYSESPFIPGSLPYNKGYAQAQWDYKGFQLINTFNYIGDYKDFGAFVNHSNLVLPTVDPANIQFTRTRDVKAYLTFDTQVSYTYTAPRAEAGAADAKETGRQRRRVPVCALAAWLDQTTIRIGVNHIFDSPPPFSAAAVGRNANYDTSLYSIRGRYYYIGLNKKF